MCLCWIPGRLQCYNLMPRAPGPTPTCCMEVSKARIKEPIVSCVEQRKSTFRHCRTHAFMWGKACAWKHKPHFLSAFRSSPRTLSLFFLYIYMKNVIVCVSYLSLQLYSFTTANKTDHCVDPAATWLPRRFERLQRVGLMSRCRFCFNWF